MEKEKKITAVLTESGYNFNCAAPADYIIHFATDTIEACIETINNGDPILRRIVLDTLKLAVENELEKCEEK